MPLSSSDSSTLLSVTDICNYLRLDRSTVYGLTTAGKLPAFRINGHWCFSREEIELRLSPPVTIQPMTGHTVPERARGVSSESMKRRWADPQYAAKVNRTKYISSEKRRQIIELLKEKSSGSFAAVAKAVGVDIGTVTQIAQQAGIELSVPTKLSATMKSCWADPEFRARRTESMRRRRAGSAIAETVQWSNLRGDQPPN
jgi:excisionase family DNA binding protein